MKRLSAALAACALLTGCAGSDGEGGEGGDGDAAEVRVVHAPTTLFSPLYLADAKGYFAEEGLEIQLETVQAGQDAIPLAASGQVEAVVAGFSAGMFNALSEGLEISIVGSMGASPGTSPGPSSLMVDQELVESGEISSPSDLAGREVAIAGGPGGAGGYQIDAVLREDGDVRLADLEVTNIAFPDMQAAIESGSVAAAYPPAPFTTEMEQSGVAVEFAVPPSGTTATGVIYGGEFHGTEESEAFFRALQRGAEDLQGDGAADEENLEILAEATGQDLDVLREVPHYIFSPDLAPDVEQLQAQQESYADAGLLDYTELLSEDDYIDASVSAQ